VAAGRGFVRVKRNWLIVERFSVLRKERLQVPRCKLWAACANKFDPNGCRGVRRHARY